MPGIVRLSRGAYETLGDQVASELEAGFDHVEAVSRAAHRELIDLIVERRVGEAKADLRVDFKDVEVRLRQEISAFESRLLLQMADLRDRFATSETRILKWNFLFWVSTLAMLVLKG